MRLHRKAIPAVLTLLLCSPEAHGQFGTSPAAGITSTPVLSQWVRSGWLKFRVVSGRIALGGTRQHHNVSSSSSSPNRRERLSMRTVSGQTTLFYQHSTPTVELSIEFRVRRELRLSRIPKGDSAGSPIRFEQPVNRPLVLAVGDGDQQRVYRGQTLWHLWILEPDVCRTHLLPMLKLIRPDWKLNERVAAVERELLRLASGQGLPDRRQWAELVEKLGDDRFPVREAADRQLRQLGPAALPYLQRLDFGRLDAEQQFRVRRIIRAFSQQTEDDTPASVADRLVADPEIWLALLGRPQEATRRAAAGQLARLLGGPIGVDPGADPATQEDQIRRLRARIVGEERPAQGGEDGVSSR